jgi:hypothetical protein
MRPHEPLHCGRNDYRTVDLPGVPGEDETPGWFHLDRRRTAMGGTLLDRKIQRSSLR